MCLKLYLLILKITLMSFGGAYSIWALAATELARDCQEVGKNPEQLKSASGKGLQSAFVCRQDFNTILGLSEILPGPQVNALAMLAFPQLGILGMFAIILALVTPGLLSLPMLHYVKKHIKLFPQLSFLKLGISIATLSILGLFLVQMIIPILKNNESSLVLIPIQFFVVFWLSYRHQMNPLILILLGGVFGFLFLK